MSIETIEGTKICRICDTTQSVTAFGSHKGHRDGLQNYCKLCRNSSNRGMLTLEQKANKQRNSVRYYGRRKVNRRGMRYGVTADQFTTLLAQQAGRCAICKGVETYEHRELCVDHDHICCGQSGGCGECVRGLLCSRCNKALGGFRDDPGLLASAIQYLAAWQVKQGSREEKGSSAGL